MPSWGSFLWLTVAVASILVAALVYFARPDRPQNRLLGLALVLDGLSFLMIASRVAADTSRIATASLLTQVCLLIGAIFAYLAFLGTLDTPVTAPLRSRTGRAVAVAAGAGLVSALLARPDWFYPSALVAGPRPWRWTIIEPGIVLVALLMFHIVVLAFALAAAFHARTRARPGTPARSRAAWYVASFAVRDAVLLVNWIGGLLHLRTGTSPAETVWGKVEMVALPASIFVFCALVAYAILRHQLFDIDLRIKWTLRRGTVAAAYLAVFLVAAQVAQNFLSDELGWAIGGAAAGLLLFALAPLQRFAERLSDKTMPRVQETSEYVAFRKHEVYKATLEDMLGDGRLTPKDKRILAGMRRRLGIAEPTALALERDAVAARGVA